MQEAALSLRKLRKTYRDVVAVDTVDLELARGEFVTFLGPSGSGKTTTLQMIAGLQNPTSGSILMNGEPLDPLPTYRRNIGVVFQHYALFPHMTLAKNIAFPLEMRRVPAGEVRRRVEETLALVGLPGYGDRYPGQLSGGQQQRIALARALVFEPQLLLMDEPLGALDKKLREQMQLEIMRLHRELDASIIYVTHDQEEALVMSDRIAVFNEGRIEQVGTAQDLYERPRTAFVAGFVGESNFFPGRVGEIDGTTCAIDTPSGRLRGRNDIGLSPGDDAVLAVRPERMRLAAGSEELSGGGIEATVSEIIYLGQSRKYVLKLDGGADITALQQAHEADSVHVSVGERLRLAWRTEDASVLPAGRAAPGTLPKETR